MWIKPYHQVDEKRIELPDAQSVTMRVLIGPDQDVPTCVMRHFTVEPGGHTPRHTHPYEHEIFFLGGTGQVFYEGETVPVAADTCAYVAPDAEHQIRTTGTEPLTFLCIVPKEI